VQPSIQSDPALGIHITPMWRICYYQPATQAYYRHPSSRPALQLYHHHSVLNTCYRGCATMKQIDPN